MTAWMVLVSLALAGPEANQTVQLDVVVPNPVSGLQVWAEVRWLGQTQRVDLEAESSPGSHFAATITDRAIRVLPIELYVQTDNILPVVVYSATESVAHPSDSFSWVLDLSRDDVHALRIAHTAPPEHIGRSDRLGVIAAIGWAIFVLNYVGWLWIRSRKTV